MKKLQKSDLKEGEIYKQLEFNYIFLYNKNETSNSFNDGTAISTYGTRYHKRWSGNSFIAPMIEATSEEKHWLETCIKENKFISYEEAMKTFIPEYVECIEKNVYDYGTNVIGKIYKVFGVTPNHINPDYLIEYGGIKYLSVSKHRFKPSTKEAYDAQFVVKEPEFVLPEKWCIKLTNENQKTVIDYINRNTEDGKRSGNIGMYYGYNGVHCTCIFKTLSKTEITFDQFKQYVLKENTTVTEEPKVVLEEPKDKVLAHLIQSDITLIYSVECSEGGVYIIGDKIIVFDKYSPNKGKPFTIKSFRWSNDKSKICAVTELHTPNGIGLDKIELYVEPKVKVKDNFVLPEKWCVKVNFEIRNRFGYYEAYGYHHSIQINDTNKWSINIKEGFTEITFEQFKKYVLKDE